MPAANPLEQSLTDSARERLESGEFIAVGMAGMRAIQPIAGFLSKTFDLVEDMNDLAIVVVRIERKK